ncbi:MAG: hemerythrin domain-containing protein [Deltaproteobacteria bacterium]|nr:hemerythrin domain-containing protein [Deltaproteobacteria bacterium]
MTTNNEERGQPGRVDPNHPAERIVEEHRTLREQLEIIAAATTRTALLSGLLHMPKTLREHFDLEEQSGGLYDDLQVRRPAISRELDALRAEHEVILNEFDALCLQLKQWVDDKGALEEISEPMTGDVGRCLDRLRQHEHEESRVIGDVYYTDEGGLG